MGAVVLVLGTMWMLPAQVSAISFDITVPNPAIDGFPPPFAQVTVTRTDATHATVTFTSYTNVQSGATYCNATTPCTYSLGGGGMVALNVNASSFTVSNTSPATISKINIGPTNEDGFGDFNLVIDNDDGVQKATTTVSFTLTNTSGTWANDASVITQNDGGSTAAAHIFVTSDGCGGAGEPACVTGFAANGQQVPEPATLLLLGSAAAGLGAWTRRRLHGRGKSAPVGVATI